MRFTCLGAQQVSVIRKWFSNFRRQSYISTILDVQDQKHFHSTMLYAYPFIPLFKRKD